MGPEQNKKFEFSLCLAYVSWDLSLSLTPVGDLYCQHCWSSGSQTHTGISTTTLQPSSSTSFPAADSADSVSVKNPSTHLKQKKHVWRACLFCVIKTIIGFSFLNNMLIFKIEKEIWLEKLSWERKVAISFSFVPCLTQ